jgi:acid phosphatase (class A)
MIRFIDLALCAGLFVACATSSAFAADFLAPSDYVPERLLPPPPPEGSPLAKAELKELDAIQSQRTPAEFARANDDFRTRNGTIFAQAIGPGFILARLPATAKMLSDVQRQEDTANEVAKEYFKRPRPWLVDPGLKSCSKQDPPQSAYPSGHSTMAYAMAVVLTALIPARATAIMSRAANYAQNRLVCGMHRRSDIQAGQVLGTVVGELLLRSPSFRPEYDAAKAELTRTHVIP